MYEGVPTYPDPGRLWRIAERLGVPGFHTASSVIRLLRKLGPDEPAGYRYHFRHITTSGERIELDVWRWYHEAVGKGKRSSWTPGGRPRTAASWAAPCRRCSR
jgi:acetyl-CoA synthetase